MIAADFAYYQPQTLQELPDALAQAGGDPYFFYAGGSEILSMARAGSIAPQAVIDVKALADLRRIRTENQTLILGAAATLSEIAESGVFPLLGTTASRIADHTNQCRITLGGNVCGTIIYREAVLPLLLADAQVTLWQNGQLHTEPLAARFCQRFIKAPDELIVDFRVPASFVKMPYVHVKRTRGDKIDYPLATIAAVGAPDGIRLAFSGVYPYPFRDPALEKIASLMHLTPQIRAQRIIAGLTGPVQQDFLAKADYRLFVLQAALVQTLERLEGLK